MVKALLVIPQRTWPDGRGSPLVERPLVGCRESCRYGRDEADVGCACVR
jgi:hypothetical protein